MTLMFARAGTDLRQVHSRSFRPFDTPAPVQSPAPRGTLVQKLGALIAEARLARRLTRELNALGDGALEDIGIHRAEIPRVVSRMIGRRRTAPVQSLRGLGAHLLADLAMPVQCGDTRVYTSVPLGVLTGRPIAGMPANQERQRRIA